jgi:hypothetical protein
MYELKRVEKDAGKAGTLEGDPNNAQSRRKLFLKKAINLSLSICPVPVAQRYQSVESATRCSPSPQKERCAT